MADELETQLNGLKNDLDQSAQNKVDAVKSELEIKLQAAEQKASNLEAANLDQVKRLEELEKKSKDQETKAKHASLESELKALNLTKSSEKVSQAELKAAASITVSGFVPDAATPYATTISVEAGLNEAPRTPLVVVGYMDVQGTNSRTIVWINKTNAEGNAAFIGEGVLKPLRSFDITPETSTAKKIAVRFKVSTESLEDVPMLAGEIRTDGFQNLNEQTSAGLLNGNGTGDNPKGLIPQASAYTLTSIKGLEPDNFGAIRAAQAQIQSLNFIPNVVIVNPIDAANMDLTKASDGHYVIPPFKSATGLVIAGLPVEISNEIPVGSFLVGDLKRFHVRVYKAPIMDMGTDSDDFSKNMRTIIVEQRLHAYLKSVDAGAIVYDTFANIKAALTPAP